MDAYNHALSHLNTNQMEERETRCYAENCVPARVSVGVMGFFMFLVAQMIRVNLYISMVPITEQFTANQTAEGKNSQGWNENSLGMLLSAFYWTYWATELPGGLLAQKFGGRMVLGVGVTLAGILNVLLPLAIDTHYLLASFVRSLQGLALGVTWPAMHWLLARWTPPCERSKFMSVYHGSAVGIAITYPLSGLLIQHLGWKWVFYMTAVFTIIWAIAWYIFVFDSPSNHPRISQKEQKYLQDAAGAFVTKKGKTVKTPWKEIMKSRAFWGVVIASQGLMWGTITLSMQKPLYFREVHHLDIKTIGFFTGIPEVCKFVFSLVFSSLTDKALQKNIMSVTVARKFAVAVCEYIPTVLLTFLAFYGSSSAAVALALLAFGSAVGGASSSGSLANIVDLSPNHAGTILGLVKTLTVIPGVISPMTITYITRSGSDPELSWRNAFLLTALIYFVCCTFYQFCGSAKMQPWNQIEEEKKDPSTELLQPQENGQQAKEEC